MDARKIPEKKGNKRRVKISKWRKKKGRKIEGMIFSRIRVCRQL